MAARPPNLCDPPPGGAPYGARRITGFAIACIAGATFAAAAFPRPPMSLRTFHLRIRPVLRSGLETLGYLTIAASGAVATCALIGLAYRRELARIREYRPAATLCSYDYDQAALWLVPLGACAALFLSGLVQIAWRRWRRTVSGPADEGGDGAQSP
ncbi:MAG TPA: hypothetical protein VM847_00940 [Tahibacter sp.]|nr:hypothetical protein [Tahibacter sp.]